MKIEVTYKKVFDSEDYFSGEDITEDYFIDNILDLFYEDADSILPYLNFEKID